MSEPESMRSTAGVLEHHMAAFGEQDLTEFLSDYTDESVIITNIGTYRGLDEIQGLAEELFAEFAQDGVELTYDMEEVEGEVGYFAWHGETPENVYEFGTDTFVIRDGIIEYQTFGMKVTPKP